MSKRAFFSRNVYWNFDCIVCLFVFGFLGFWVSFLLSMSCPDLQSKDGILVLVPKSEIGFLHGCVNLEQLSWHCGIGMSYNEKVAGAS